MYEETSSAYIRLGVDEVNVHQNIVFIVNLATVQTFNHQVIKSLKSFFPAIAKEILFENTCWSKSKDLLR